MRNENKYLRSFTARFRARQSLNSLLSSRKHEKRPFRTQKSRPIPHSASPLANIIQNILTPHSIRILILLLPLLFAPLASASPNTSFHSTSSVSVYAKSSKTYSAPKKHASPKRKANVRREPLKRTFDGLVDALKSDFLEMFWGPGSQERRIYGAVALGFFLLGVILKIQIWIEKRRKRLASRLAETEQALVRQVHDLAASTDLDLSRVRTEVQKIMAGPSLIVNSLRSIRVDWRVAQAKETLNKFADLMAALISFRTAHRTLMSQERQDELADAEFDEKISAARFKAKRAKKMSDALEDDGEDIDV